MDTKSCTQKHQTHSFTVIFTTQTGPYPVHFSPSILTALENTSCLVIHTLLFYQTFFIHVWLHLHICYFEVTSTKQLFAFFAWWSLVRCCAVARVLLCRCQALLSGCQWVLSGFQNVAMQMLSSSGVLVRGYVVSRGLLYTC